MVVGLDLSNTGFSSSIDSNSSLFRLLHLQKLNLGGIYFGSSRIPPAIGKLSSLTSLNLSFCGFLAPIPSGFFGWINNLSSLDLSGNFGVALSKSDLENLIDSLNKLEELRLSYLNLPFGLPDAIGNLSSLRSLIADHSYLQGDFPVAVFKLPNIEYLDISVNPRLSGHFPEFHSGSRLKSILVSFTNFSRELPLSSTGNLRYLNVLDISNCYFWGSIPSSLSKLTNLSTIRLSNNNFHGPVPSLANLSHITSLDMSKNRLSGDVMSSIRDLFLLENLDLSYNNFTGEIAFVSQTRLVSLKLGSNRFQGSVQLDLLLHHNKDLKELNLEYNNLSVIANSDMRASPNYAAQLRDLQLASCNLKEFPKVLQNQTELFRIDMSQNNISGKIPVWFKNVSSKSLISLNLSHNFLTGFSEECLIPSEWRILGALDLRYNELQGSLPTPPQSISEYLVSNNQLTGEIPPQFCNCSNLETLDLSKNHLTGAIPQCLSNFNLRILSLHGNNLRGRIPFQLFEDKCDHLQMIDLGENQLQGPLPRSMSRCGKLMFLNLGDNNIEDTFPSWLSSLASLTVLILRSNKFHGEITEEETNEGGSGFSMLHIVDLSHNNFAGYLPSQYFDLWTSMKVTNLDKPEYLKTIMPYLAYDSAIGTPLDGLTSYEFSMTIVSKGLQMEYAKILNYFTVIDFSSNNFIGDIPSSISRLKGIHLLNLSNNALTGPIPPFLGALVNLEALDLSHNNLSGQIPKELTRLNFLVVFNVSYNNLSREIPQGSQFGTFSNSSYMDNEGLCGVPLSRKCGNVGLPPPPPSDHEDEGSVNRILEWKAVMLGYTSSFIIAVIIGHKIITVRRGHKIITVIVRTFKRGTPGRRRS